MRTRARPPSDAAGGVSPAEIRQHAAAEPQRGPPLDRAPSQPAILDRIRHEAELDHQNRHVRPVEAREVGALPDAAVRKAEGGDELSLDEHGRTAARAVHVVGPAAPERRHHGVGAAHGARRRPVGVDAQEERRPGTVGDPGARDVAHARPLVPGPREHDADAGPLEQRLEQEGDAEVELGLRQAADDAPRAAPVLDLARRRPRPDRLGRGVPAQVVAGIEDDDGSSGCGDCRGLCRTGEQNKRRRGDRQCADPGSEGHAAPTTVPAGESAARTSRYATIR